MEIVHPSRRETSFGWMEVWAECGGEPVTERLHFERNGRGHEHDWWEYVRVLGGKGVIVVGEDRVAVGRGDAVDIPPGLEHWMETEFGLDIVLQYGPNRATE